MGDEIIIIMLIVFLLISSAAGVGLYFFQRNDCETELVKGEECKDGFYTDTYQVTTEKGWFGKCDVKDGDIDRSRSCTKSAPGTTVPTSCAVNQYLRGDTCVSCPGGTYREINNVCMNLPGGVQICEPGTIDDCTGCLYNQYYDGTNCLSCPNNKVRSARYGKLGTCDSCSKSNYFDGTKCVSCPPNTERRQDDGLGTLNDCVTKLLPAGSVCTKDSECYTFPQCGYSKCTNGICTQDCS